MSHLFVGVDIGSSATKAVLLDETGALVASTRREHEISTPHPGWAEMDAERDWWGGACETIGSLLQQGSVEGRRVAGIGVCGVGASFVPVDVSGRTLRPAILYGIDSRASEIVSSLRDELGDQFLLRSTGRLLSSQSVGPKVNWLRQHEPSVWNETTQILTPASLVAHRLCGSSGLDYHTALSFDPLFDATRFVWHEDMCDRLVGPQFKLPRVMAAGECVGVLHAQAAKVTGLPQGIPVACGTADVVAEALGAGVSRLGDMMVMYGSTLFLLERTPTLQASPPLWPSIFLDQSQPTLLTGTSNAGSLLAWFRREFVRTPSEFHELLAQASALAPGAEGLLCVPYFAGERAPVFDPMARGLFLGMTARHTRAHMLRALVEGIALSFRHLSDVFEAGGQAPERLLASGGGVQIDLWTQTMSDVVGLPQYIPSHTGGAALGAAYLGAQACGLARLGDAMPETWLAGSKKITPQYDRAYYDDLYSMYLESYGATRDLMHQLARSSTRRVRR